MSQSKLYLIDGMSLVFRAYHAMSNTAMRNSEGEPTGAVFGFTNMITSLLERFNPEKIAVVFDRAEPTFRHNMYEAYKANRDEFPEELVPQLKRIKEFLDLSKIPRIEKAGFEADDIIGTLAKKAAAQGNEVVCLTSDKDYYQLVEGNISLLKPGRKGEDFERINIPEVIEKFGVTPDKVIDVLAIIGDSSDNIPGVKGVGEKTAIPLVQKYGSLESIYENLNEIERTSLKTKFEEARDMAFLSKILVTIDTDVQLDFTYEDCVIKEAKFIELDKFFEIMNFNTIRSKWRNKAPAGFFDNNNAQKKDSEIQSAEVLGNIETNYEMITSLDRLDLVISELSKSEILSFDLETDSLDKQNCEIVGISLSAKEGTGYYIPVEYIGKEIIEEEESLFSEPKINNSKKWDESLNIDDVILRLKPILEDEKIGKCGQNVKFDMFILKRHNIGVTPIVFDSMVASYILDPDQKHGMDALSEKYLNYKPISISSLIGEKKATQKSMRDLPPSEISNYACEDADVALKLKNVLDKLIIKENLNKLAYDIEFPIIEVLNLMEFQGVAINTNALKDISKIIKVETERLQKLIYSEAGQEFNIDSPKQLGEILFEKMMIPAQKKNKTGYSTDVQVLTELSESFPIAEYVLDYRQITKLQSTYVEALPKLINKHTGRIHTTYNQTVASTGRLSSTDPNLQNIPIRTDLGKEIRKAFVPQHKDYVILSADYSQVELRIMAYICGDEYLINAFKENNDIHAATAAILNGISIEEVNQDMRRIAKTVNFGIMYGLGSFGLAQRLGLSRTAAKEIIDNYFEKYPGIRKYMDITINSAREKGYAETLCGRRRYFENIDSRNANLRTAAERGAINMPIQGTASDMMKIAMLNIHKYITQNNLKSKMMLQVHDELVFEAHNDELKDLRNNVIRLMSESLSLGEVPVIVDTGTGSNWFEAH
ncbi:MAG: DNA polymerase I [Candidatus Kapabacteria bacterium]|nr:DNA polymerase I [Ignavibacteriota bacterium]MCW5883530.1 DNA polymerase I [Candidatus Kapabacteria bacterium]